MRLLNLKHCHFNYLVLHSDLSWRIFNPLPLVNLLHLLLHVLDPLLKKHLGSYLHDELLLQSSDCIILHQAMIISQGLEDYLGDSLPCPTDDLV